MQFKAQQVFRRLAPYTVVADLGLPLKKRNDAFFTPHPKFPEYSFEIRRNELVAAEYNNPTPGCNLFDFLAMHFGSYEESFEHVSNRYFNLAMTPSGITLGSMQDELVTGLKNERQQFEDILALREPFRLQSEKLTQAYMFCRRLELSKDHAWKMFYVAIGADINRALHYSLDDSRTLNPTEFYWIFPFLENHHRFAMLEICDVNQNPVRTVKLNPSRYMFFGLHSCVPDNQQTRVFGTREEALKMHGYAMAMGDFKIGFVHVQFDPDKIMSESPISSGVFLVSEKTNFNTLVNTRLAFKEFYIADAKRACADNLPTVSWTHYAVNQIVAAFNEDGEYSPRMDGMVESLGSDRKVLHLLLRHFESGNKKEAVELIRKKLDPQGIFLAGGMQVIETSRGYLAKNSDTGFGSYFTNFLVQLDYNVWFEDRKESHYLGRVILDGNSVPFLISSEQMQNPKAILTKAQQAANEAGLTNEVSVPMINDPTFQNTLVAILAQQHGKKPKLIGVDALGWNSTKTRFTSPSWAAGINGLQRASKILHPCAKTIARYFDFQEVQILMDYSRAIAQARSLIALIAASLTRAFLNQQTVIVKVLRSPQSLGLLQAVFRPLGQVRPIELGAKRRQVEQILSTGELCGYPIYATCPDNTALDGLNYPLFLLGDSGLVLQECLDEEALGQIASLSHRIITSLVLYLLRDPVQAHSLITKQEAFSIRELTLEGKHVIEASCGLENFEILESEMPLLQSLLSLMPPAQAQEYFHYDCSAEIIRIRCPLLGMTRKPLYQELLGKHPAVNLHGDHYITCPAAWFLDLLEKFYGRSIVLQDQSTNVSVTENASECHGLPTITTQQPSASTLP